MTDLTQDWKDGKLEEGLYYVQFHNGIKICNFYELCILRFSATGDKIKILAEVPDYTAWQNLWNTADKTQAQAKDVIDIEATRKIKQLEQIIEGQKQIIESQKQTNLSLIKRLEEKLTNVKDKV